METEEEQGQLFRRKSVFQTTREVQCFGLPLFRSDLDEGVVRVKNLASRVSGAREAVSHDEAWSACELFYQNTGGDTYREEDDWMRSDLVVDQVTLPLVDLLKHALREENITSLVMYLKCIRNLSRTSSKAKMISAQICELVIGTLAKYPEKAEVTEWCLRCSANLLISEDDEQRRDQTERMIRLDLHKFVVDSFRRHGLQHPKLGEIACYVMYLVVFEQNEIRKYFFDEHVPHMIKTCLSRNAAIPSFGEAALRTICCLIGGFLDSGKDESLREEDSALERHYHHVIFTSNVMAPVVKVMNMHKDDEEISSLAICILVNLIRGDADIDNEAIEKLLALNAEYEIILCMRTWAFTNLEIAQQGCLCVFALARSENENTKTKLLSFNADSLLLRCIRRYIEDDRIVEIALATLSCLVHNIRGLRARPEMLVTTGDFVATMKQAILRHSLTNEQVSNDFSIGELVAFISLHFCQVTTSVRRKMIKKGIVQVFLLLLDKWPKRSQLCLSCSLGGLLELISVDEEVLDRHEDGARTTKDGIRRICLDISLKYNELLEANEQVGELERHDRLDIFATAQEVLMKLEIAVPIVEDLRTAQDCVPMELPAHVLDHSQVFYSHDASLLLLVENKSRRLSLFDGLAFHGEEASRPGRHADTPLQEKIVAASFSFNLRHMVLVSDERKVYAVDLSGAALLLEFRFRILPHAGERTFKTLFIPSDVNFVSFIRDDPEAIIISYIESIADFDTWRLVARTYYKGIEFDPASSLEPVHLKISKNGEYLLKSPSSVNDNATTRIHKFVFKNEAYALSAFRHPIPLAMADGEIHSEGQFALIQHQNRQSFSLWKVGPSSHPVAMKAIHIQFPVKLPAHTIKRMVGSDMCLGRSRFVVSARFEGRQYVLQMFVDDSARMHSMAYALMKVFPEDNVLPSCVLTRDENFVVTGKKSDNLLAWDLQCENRRKIHALASTKRLEKDALLLIGTFLF